jgi:hypothetical protein
MWFQKHGMWGLSEPNQALDSTLHLPVYPRLVTVPEKVYKSDIHII